VDDLLNRVSKINYLHELNARQQEQYLFQKCSAIFADYGYATIKLSDDWQGADFIAISHDSKKSGEFFKIQLKGRFTISKKYEGKDIYVAFPVDLGAGRWCIYPHDELIERVMEAQMYLDTKSWSEGGEYSVPTISKRLEKLLEKYMIS
jgi:hypothetical protein